MSTTNTSATFTNKQTSTINLINREYKNPTQITRAQIKAMVDAGDFAWPYWITDHKCGYVIKRGLYRMPGTVVADAAPLTVPVATAWFAITPKGSKSTVKFDEPVTASYASDSLTARLLAAKKSAKWVSADLMQPVA